MNALRRMRSGDALLIVDVQNDFCPGGALPVTHGDEVVGPLNRWIAVAAENACPVIASRDWHPQHHPSFVSEGGPWPEHCVQDTPGAALRPDLALPTEIFLVSKGTRFDKDQYSAFDDTGLAVLLSRLGISRVIIGGLALDVCVRATVLDARREGFEAALILDATRAVNLLKGTDVLKELESAGVELL
jgi:nicotinamidase/pyrazinamidase